MFHKKLRLKILRYANMQKKILKKKEFSLLLGYLRNNLKLGNYDSL